MTLQQMKYILSVAKCGSISKAASDLFLSQSSLSLSIKELEQSLGITIFKRTNRGVVLTSDGKEYADRAAEILSMVGALEGHFLHKQLPMRFSVSTQRLAFAVKAFSRYLRDFSSEASDIAIRECHTYAVMQDVADGRSDIGVIALSDANEKSVLTELAAKDIDFIELETLVPVAFMATSHPLARSSSVTLSQLDEYAFITYDQEVSVSHYSEEPVFYGRFRKNIHVSDRSSKLALIRTNNCFSIELDLPNNASLKEASGKNIKWARICPVPVAELTAPFRIGYLIRKGCALDAAGSRYIALLREEVMALKKSRGQ